MILGSYLNSLSLTYHPVKNEVICSWPFWRLCRSYASKVLNRISGIIIISMYSFPNLPLIVFILIFVILLWLSQFFPLCPPLPIPLPAPTVNPHTVVYVRGSFIHVLWLVPSSSFHHYSLPSSHCQSVPCFHATGSILLIG